MPSKDIFSFFVLFAFFNLLSEPPGGIWKWTSKSPNQTYNPCVRYDLLLPTTHLFGTSAFPEAMRITGISALSTAPQAAPPPPRPSLVASSSSTRATETVSASEEAPPSTAATTDTPTRTSLSFTAKSYQ